MNELSSSSSADHRSTWLKPSRASEVHCGRHKREDAACDSPSPRARQAVHESIGARAFEEDIWSKRPKKHKGGLATTVNECTRLRSMREIVLPLVWCR